MCVGEEFARKFWFRSALWLSSSILLVLGLLPFLIALLTFAVLTKLELPLLSLYHCCVVELLCFAISHLLSVVHRNCCGIPEHRRSTATMRKREKPVRCETRSSWRSHTRKTENCTQVQRNCNLRKSKVSSHSSTTFFLLLSVPWAHNKLKMFSWSRMRMGDTAERSSTAMWRESWSFQATISGVVTEVDFGTAPRIDFICVKLVNRNNKAFFSFSQNSLLL